MRELVSKDYVRIWRTVCVGWLGWSEKRFERFLRAFNEKLASENGAVWFYHDPPLHYVIPLLVTDQFEEWLHHEVRKPKYGTPEWVYFRSELLSAIEGDRGTSAKFDWKAAKKRAQEHVAIYREAFPPPEAVTNYEKWILKFEPLEASYPAGGNAGSALRFAIERHWPGVPQPARSAKARRAC